METQEFDNILKQLMAHMVEGYVITPNIINIVRKLDALTKGDYKTLYEIEKHEHELTKQELTKMLYTYTIQHTTHQHQHQHQHQHLEPSPCGSYFIPTGIVPMYGYISPIGSASETSTASSMPELIPNTEEK